MQDEQITPSSKKEKSNKNTKDDVLDLGDYISSSSDDD